MCGLTGSKVPLKVFHSISINVDNGLTCIGLLVQPIMLIVCNASDVDCMQCF